MTHNSVQVAGRGAPATAAESGARELPGRYFFALWPRSGVRSGMAAAASRWLEGMPGRSRRMDASQYHLTLLFLGRLSPGEADRLSRLRQKLRDSRCKSFELELDCTGHFGSRVGWLGCGRIPSALMALHDRLRKLAMDSGFDLHEEKAGFVPHVTVARDVHGSWNADTGIAESIHWQVDEFVLACSVPARKSAYRIEERFALSP